jgi:hypothetical protein
MEIRKPTPMGAVLAGVIIVVSLALVPAAMAGKPTSGGGGGGGGHKGSSTSYTGSFVNTNPVMVTDANGNNAPNFGDQITFSVTSNATYYDVELDCSQNGTVVFRQVVGFGMGWSWSQDYTLKSSVWTGGAADCTAVLFASNSDGSNRQNLASLAFPVGA